MILFPALEKNNITYHRLDIRIAATDNTYFDAWLGAYLRNNLLYAAEHIIIKEENASLFEYLNRFPLIENHPFYKELHNGFPLPYYIFIHYPVNFSDKELLVRKNEIVSFSLILIGNITGFFRYFIEALRYMCKRGFGVSKKPFELLDIYEVQPKGGKRIIAVSNENFTQELLYPICISDFVENKTLKDTTFLNIEFESPACLIKSRRTENKILGFQEKTNGFPSFYQLVRTAVYRYMKLNTLYASPDDFEKAVKIDERVEEYINGAVKLTLEYAEIKHISLNSTRKEGTKNRIPLRGYVGKLSFKGKYDKYLPLLQFMQELGVGHELVYGFGKYRIY